MQASDGFQAGSGRSRSGGQLPLALACLSEPPRPNQPSFFVYDHRRSWRWHRYFVVVGSEGAMIALLILASLSRCLAPSPCPTDQEIADAIHNHDDPLLWLSYNQMLRDNPSKAISPDSAYAKRSERIERISDVLCSDELPSELPGNPTVINCRFTLHRWDRVAFTTARMARRSGGWSIDHILVVTRMLPGHRGPGPTPK